MTVLKRETYTPATVLLRFGGAPISGDVPTELDPAMARTQSGAAAQIASHQEALAPCKTAAGE